MTDNAIWNRLQQHYQDIAHYSLAALFCDDPGRAARFTIETEGLYIDYSKNRINKDTLALLSAFIVDKRQLPARIEQLFSGSKINGCYGPALHPALRGTGDRDLHINGDAVFSAIAAELEKIASLLDQLHSGRLMGSSKKRIDTVVNIGIGGSDLGPRFVVDALQEIGSTDYAIHFISNIDPGPLARLLGQIDPQTTLFIISSKSFTTLETVQNARTVKQWLTENGCHDSAAHLVAVTANIEKAMAFGIERDRIFKLWEWVGGRYSLWSAVGLTIAIAIGYQGFRQLLSGAASMDRHFREMPLGRNAPVILALLDCWYSNFFNAQGHAIIPYDNRLALLPAYLAQLIMESNGKTTDHHGEQVGQQTAPIIFGSTGTDAQHSFFQALHQGTNLIPVDLLAPLACHGEQTHHDWLFVNCIAQAQALMQGEPHQDRHKSLTGNRPSTTILYKTLTPFTLGELLALFEHRTFVQSVFWDINPFDQWGVELGKRRARQLFQALSDQQGLAAQDTSTQQLLRLYQQHRIID